eukprot:m.480486 g.480486  ORF g.480486 m.480486 type:complete len:289 (+) comp21707_c0_seq32:423-1289(+)
MPSQAAPARTLVFDGDNYAAPERSGDAYDAFSEDISPDDASVWDEQTTDLPAPGTYEIPVSYVKSAEPPLCTNPMMVLGTPKDVKEQNVPRYTRQQGPHRLLNACLGITAIIAITGLVLALQNTNSSTDDGTTSASAAHESSQGILIDRLSELASLVQDLNSTVVLQQRTITNMAESIVQLETTISAVVNATSPVSNSTEAYRGFQGTMPVVSIDSNVGAAFALQSGGLEDVSRVLGDFRIENSAVLRDVTQVGSLQHVGGNVMVTSNAAMIASVDCLHWCSWADLCR